MVTRAIALACTLSCLVACGTGGPKPADPAILNATAASPARTIPDGIDPAQTSEDATYGFTRENPVRVGMEDEYSGPAASQVYLRHLRDKQFKPFRFRRMGSVGGSRDEHMLDKYELTSSTGEKFEIYIDMYHPENTPLRQAAPKGMYFWK